MAQGAWPFPHELCCLWLNARSSLQATMPLPQVSFYSEIRSPDYLSPSQVVRSFDSFCNSGDSSGPHLPSFGGILALGPALPCVWGANASGLAATALSVLPVGSMPVAPLTRAGAVLATSSTFPFLFAPVSAHSALFSSQPHQWVQYQWPP